MKRSLKAESILGQINSGTKLGDLRKIGKDIRRDHELAMELWSTRQFHPRLLAILIMDSKLLVQDLVDRLDKDMRDHPFDERNQLMDWLMANQLAKDKNAARLMASWQHSPSSLQRRTFWYYQARLRWLGQTPPPNTEGLLAAMEEQLAGEVPEVQWAMNFTAGWIGVYDKAYRARCMEVGRKTGLYKGEKVSKGCTPNYLPEFIAIESEKRKL